MDLHDDQPTHHTSGSRSYVVADVEPLDVDGVRTVAVGSVLWLVGFVALLPFYGRLMDNGHAWWLWSCMAGAGLGLIGLEYCRRRRAVRLESQGPDGPRRHLVSQPSRWELAAAEHGVSGYAQHFADLIAEGADIEGEARLADVLVGRSAAILDVGSGMGRVSAALVARGHRVTSIEPDPALRAQSAQTYPDLPVVATDALGFDPAAAGAPAAYDLVVCVGNVLVYLAEGSERAVLARLRDLLAPGGRVLAGFHLVSARLGARDYPAADFVADADAAGLRVDGRFGSYELHPPTDDYGVWVLTRA